MASKKYVKEKYSICHLLKCDAWNCTNSRNKQASKQKQTEQTNTNKQNNSNNMENNGERERSTGHKKQLEKDKYRQILH